MKFERLLEVFAGQPYFDYPSVRLHFQNEKDHTSRTALSRFIKRGVLHELKRGFYAFSEPYLTRPLNPLQLAQALYAPSYVSELWALSWYGIIPEKVTLITSVTTRVTRTFKNILGEYRYRTIDRRFFHSWQTEEILSEKVRIATPEKALLDLWYLEKGEWTVERMESMRFEPRLIDAEKLYALAQNYPPRLIRAVKSWVIYAEQTAKGEIIL
jgi:predicted transcriptional regulator of viral defense system